MIQGLHDGSMNGHDTSDEELMSGLAAGRLEALGPLHTRYAPMVFAIAARSLGHAEAEEIVQDVFVAVWQKAATFDPSRGTFRSWAIQITQHRVFNELRRRGRRPSFESDHEGHHLGNAPEPSPGPEEATWIDHRRAILRAAVEALPPPQRQALSLAFLEDLTHQQIADLLELPLGTAKTRVRAGLQSLRTHLAPLLAAGLLIAALGTSVLLRDAMQRTSLRRQDAALRLVTSSDVAPRRLTAVAGAPSEAHGNYRGRPGIAMAVTTISHFPPAQAGSVYRAWGLFNGRWHLLGTVNPDAKGSDLLISEGSHLTTPPTALKVTRESNNLSPTPTGPSVITWPNP